MDGTLYRGARLFAQTLPFLERLRRLAIGCTFLTNNTSRGKAEYVSKLRAFGIEADENQICTPVESVIAYLRQSLPHVKTVAVLGTPSLCREFTEAGFQVNWDAPQAVVAGFDLTLTYERLCRAAYWISAGLPFLATHPDLVCPTEEPTVLVDCGSLCACLTAATGRKPTVFGKPHPSILSDLGRRLGLAPGDMLMAGDRIYTDIRMAQDAGVPAVLVLTGEAKPEDAAALANPPDLIVADVGELGDALERARRPVAR